MNDNELQTALAESYAMTPLTNEARAQIRNRVRTEEAKPVVRPLRLAVAGFALVAIGLTIPVARANYLGYALSGQLRDTQAFTVTITVEKKPLKPGEQVPTRAIIATVANRRYLIQDPQAGGDVLWLYEPGRMLQYRPVDRRVIAFPANQSWGNLLALPNQVAERLAQFQVDKSIQNVGKVELRGRVANEVICTGTLGRVTIDIDATNGTPMRMRVQGNAMLPDMVYDYDCDATKAKAAVAACVKEVGSVPILDIEQRRNSLIREISATPLKSVGTGRDQLTIYRVDTNANGDVLVLYTCKGYHGAEDRFGNWLRLQDSSGKQWLADVIDMSFSKLKLNGEFAKAQLFVHPEKNTHAGRLRLFAEMREWEFVSQQVVQPVREVADRRKEIGAFAASRASVEQPDWLYYSLTLQSPTWLAADAQKLRFVNALRKKDFALAKRLGQEYELKYADLMVGVFFDKAQLWLGLYKAFRETGDRDAARMYLSKLIASGTTYLGDYYTTQELNAARRVEGL